jgi:aminoglycoside 6'-N-acetyltransferase
MGVDDAISFRPMTENDMRLFETWLHRPHFARWFLPDSTIEDELASNRDAITGADPTRVFMVRIGDRDVGWAQYYRWSDYPDEAAKYDAGPGDVGIDYGIGEPDLIGVGVGTRLIAGLVAVLTEVHPGRPILVGPSAANAASCRVLEKNGFVRVGVRDMPGEPNASPLALYRLAANESSPGVSGRSPSSGTRAPR